MKKCPYCAEEVQDGAKVCGRCHADLAVAPTPGGPVKPWISGKAILSFVLGIFSSVYFFPGILAIVLGHISRKEIRQSAGRMRGARIALAGLILAYGGLFVFINIGNFLKSWLAQKNASAVGSLRTLNAVAGTYAAAHGGGYPTNLDDLLPPANQNPDAQTARMLMDGVPASGWMPGYIFTYVPSDENEKGIPKSYSIRADPVEGIILHLIIIGHFGFAEAVGSAYFFTDQTGVIRIGDDKPADKDSRPIVG